MPGPYVQAAAICEKVLHERDGVLSLIRLIDRITLSTNAPEAPAEMPEGRLQVTYAVLLKAGDAQGRYPVTVDIETPAGLSLPPQTVEVTFEGQDRGVNLILAFQLEVLEGLYWFSVSVNSRELTRTPLRVMYQRVPGPQVAT